MRGPWCFLVKVRREKAKQSTLQLEEEVLTLVTLPRVIFTTPVIGFPPIGGPELRIHNTISVLAPLSSLVVQVRRTVGQLEKKAIEEAMLRLGCAEVWFSNVEIAEEVSRSIGNRLRRIIGERILGFSNKRALSAILREVKIGGEPILWFGYGNISYPLLKRTRRALPFARIVCDTDSVWSRFLLRGVPYTSHIFEKIILLARGRKKQMEEIQMTRISNVTVAVSDVDADYYQSRSHSAVTMVLSNAIDISNNPLEQSNEKLLPPKSVCLTGTFGHRSSPMDVGARWLIEEVWEKVLATVPDAHLFIVGKDSDRTLSLFESDSVHVMGWVPETGPFLRDCNVVVVPLFFESGTRFKILEAGAYMRPVVSTTLGAEGLSLTNGENILISDSAEGFANAIISVILGHADPELGRRLHHVVATKASLTTLSHEAAAIVEYLTRPGDLPAQT